MLSEDFVETSIHTPVKTLVYVVKLPKIDVDILSKDDYVLYYQSLDNFKITNTEIKYDAFSSNVIFNDYELFIQKVIYRILAIWVLLKVVVRHNLIVLHLCNGDALFFNAAIIEDKL